MSSGRPKEEERRLNFFFKFSLSLGGHDGSFHESVH